MEILIADDSAVSRKLLEVELKKWGYRVISVANGTEAWEILHREDAPRMVILDWMMPGLSGVEVCHLVRQQNLPHYTYILLLTSRHEKEDLIAGMEAGADDYLIKPFDANELKVRLGPGRRIIDLQAELLQAQEALHIQATRDGLTQLWNRRAIFDILLKEVARCQREGVPLGLVIGDLDCFKEINDTYGHIAGDAVLIEVSSRMLHSVRPYDSVGRYGGEEFLLILPGCTKEDTIAAAERMRAHINHAPVQLGADSLPISASFGATTLEPGQKVAGAESLIGTADRALYLAKQQGRDRTVFSLHE
ncbi:MAG: diguanylate cyclase [Acidobacteriia bacterium]|nr:diguanylate cyclase [Terriglobia bacterium]